ncbi:AT-hook motif nuclear-localized protein 9-like [Phoenix dactylifera]|uniref:AT-hook motif nuclear-localized protein n=1 Tax=Phoenix dactylifera TaxID=42345 RepID=A0A8B7BK29_PHODC|nr:AT-hook motif nuclear-localized protein 9-like [Phoenix dactylifera]XP_008778765.2 AT-hook motif nuclear-localized protein 9-like [Phoenix dactylifera]XP_026657462.2 AT-hook motif nuclear-localized protein 9-like [Phoenix dactylifera]
MDGRDAISMSGPSPYYIQHRGIGGNSTGPQTGLHGPPPGIRSMTNPSSSLSSLQHPGMSIGSGFQVETPSSISPHGANVGGTGAAGGGPGEPVKKKKRGRPRKYGPDGTMALALSPLSSTPTVSGSGLVPGAASGSGSGSGSAAQMQKRGRGRPPGTGTKQQLASLGEWIVSSAGMGFTPHIITIPIGEDIATKIMSFSQQGPRAVCILSANGSVSTVTLRQPSSSGGTVTYEGRFEILCLSGSYLLTDNGGSRSRSGGLSISLSSPDGRVIGGGVGGLLRAASPVQVIVGSFIYGGSKTKNKTKTGQESGHESEHPVGDKLQSITTSAVFNQNLAPPSVMGGWTGSRQMDVRNTHIDIDLTRG